MEIINIKDLSKYRYEKALSNFNVAKILYESKNYGAALNRAYYSAFDAMRSINVIDGFDSSKHSGVIAHFNQEYVKTKEFPISTSNIIKRASLLREKSDYEDFYEPDDDETIELIKDVETFLKDVESYLRKQDIVK